MPFVSDSVNGQLRRLFQRAGVRVILTHRGRSLKSSLQKNVRQQRECKIPNCTTPRHLCHRRNVVYKVECLSCKAQYIGMTTRWLHIRIREHMTRESSPVKQHAVRCNSQWAVTVMATAGGSVANLQMTEALLIRQHNPSLNNRFEIASLKLL